MFTQKIRCRKGQKSFRCMAASVGLCTLALTASAAPQSAPSQGAFYGQVLDVASGKPVAGATVALQDKHNHVLSWTKTDAQGHYALAANSIALLDLPTARRRGMLATIGRGFVQVVQLPIKAASAAAGVASDTIKAVDPVGTVKAAAVGMISGSPVPLAAQATTDMQNLVGADTRQRARTTAATAVVNGTPHTDTKPKDGTPGPGEVGLLISAPQYKEYRGPSGAYWLEATGSLDHGKPQAAQAWLDTVRLAPATGDKTSDVQDQAMHLTDPALDATLAAAGATVKITVHLQTPAEPVLNVRVVAREQKTHQVTELKAQGNGVYAGDLTLDPKMALGDTTVTVAALKAAPVEPPASQGDPLLTLASHMDNLDAGKPYQFDPRITASENRLDIKMTILDPSRQMPPPAPTPAAAPAPATPPAPPPPASPAPATPPAPAGH